jgi:HTH-type transcriptional regulator/antitoxin HigA
MTTILTPAEVFPPGEYLREELEERGWTVTEFAEIIGRPVQAVSEILNGRKEITTETACALGEALGTTPNLWLNLQTNYRLFEQRTKSRPDQPSPVARRARLRNLIPLAKARARGWVPDTEDLDVLERAVTQLLEIESLDAKPVFALAARRANSTEQITLEQIAWLAHVRAVAAKQEADAFEPRALASLASEVPQLTQDGPAKLRLLPERFAECGVRLVFAEGLQGGKLDGAVTFLSDGRPVVALTTRGDRFDSLLFTLLHECAHLALGHITPESPVIVDDDLMSAQSDPNEIAANDQATAWLFPTSLEIASTSVPAILDAALDYGVHPSVVIGRIQRDTGDWRRHRTRIPKVRMFLRVCPSIGDLVCVVLVVPPADTQTPRAKCGAR